MSNQTVWRFIDTKIGSAGWNMAVDEMLLEGCNAGDKPILRLYGWEYALSAGRFSDIGSCIDVKRLEDEHFPLVRRLSGGGVLVHGDDLSYALVLPRDGLKGWGVKESYLLLCRFLFRLYEKLGYAPRFAADEPLPLIRSSVCLAGNEPYDIVINKEKMGGNAQRHTRHTLFQHGSIPMRLDAARFEPFLLGDTGLGRAATLERLGTCIEYETLCHVVKEAFCETFDARLVSEPLGGEETERANVLLRDKYAQKGWNYHGRSL